MNVQATIAMLAIAIPFAAIIARPLIRWDVQRILNKVTLRLTKAVSSGEIEETTHAYLALLGTSKKSAPAHVLVEVSIASTLRVVFPALFWDFSPIANIIGIGVWIQEKWSIRQARKALAA